MNKKWQVKELAKLELLMQLFIVYTIVCVAVSYALVSLVKFLLGRSDGHKGCSECHANEKK